MVTLKQLTNKKQKLDQYQPLLPELVKNMDDWFKVELTYTSNAIEGNTLTRQETALVVEKGLTVEGKSLREHLEATNHAEALELVSKLSQKSRQKIVEADILKLHRLILQKVDDDNAGRYRRVAVRIAGTEAVVLPNPIKVPDLMKQFVKWLIRSRSEHPVKVAAEAHFKLVSIHPFVDGNGRTARLLMNLLLIQAGYPPALIKKEERRVYIAAIETGQVKKDLDDYYQLIFKAVDRSFDIYLEAVMPKPKREMKQERNLLKIGELAEDSKEKVSTIRFWTNEGLLKVTGHTRGGYALYETAMLERVKQIRQWQKEKRLTIREIKIDLDKI